MDQFCTGTELFNQFNSLLSAAGCPESIDLEENQFGSVSSTSHFISGFAFNLIKFLTVVVIIESHAVLLFARAAIFIAGCGNCF